MGQKVGTNARKRAVILRKYGGHCAYCGIEITLQNMQIDHIVPLFRGWLDEDLARSGLVRGEDTSENKNPACASCNRLKATSPLEGFRLHIRSQLGVLLKNPTFKSACRFGQIKIIDTPIVFYFEK